MRPAARWAVLAVLAVALAGCGSLFPVPLSGTWSGVYEPVAGDDSGVILLNLSVSGATVTGTWESSLPGSLAQGTVSGAVESLVLLELTTANPPGCRFQLLAEQRGSRLQGGYMADCGAVRSGWVDLTKR